MAKFVHELIKRVELVTFPIQDGFFAYKRSVYEDGELVEEKQGIAEGHYESVDPTVPINKSKLDLYKKEIIEAHRTHQEKGYDITMYDSHWIIDPYDYAIENKLSSAVLLRFCSDYHLYDVAGNKLPRSQYIDYMSGWFDNSQYDLEQALEILEGREDVILKSDIEKIPYYNADPDAGKTHHVEFVWIPEQEDWKKVQQHNTTNEICTAIIEEVLGITKLVNNE